MVLVIPDYVFIANSLYSKQTNFLSYDELDRYYVILYQTLNKRYKYIDFDFSSNNYIETKKHIFIKLNDGIQSFYEVSKESIKSINSIYSEEVINLINESRDRFNSKQLVNKKVIK